MAANIDMTGNRYNFAYVGDANRIWWNPPQANRLQEGASFDEWVTMSGLGHRVVKADAIAELNGQRIETGQYFNVREDTNAVLSRSLSERFVNYQPRNMLQGLWDHVLPNDEYQISAAGSLLGGRKIFACVSHGTVQIASEEHKVYLLASTAFDGSAATSWSLSAVRSICANTVAAALAGAGAMIKIYHSQTVDHADVVKRLAELAQATTRYKAAGDAMASTKMAQEQVSALFKKLLAIPAEAQSLDDLSTRKANQYRDMWRAYKTSVREGAEDGSVWATWNACTRYVDHDKDARNQDAADASEARFYAAQFGNGAAMKQEAFNMLMPLIRDKVPA